MEAHVMKRMSMLMTVLMMMMTAYDEEDYGFEDKYERVFFFFVQWPSVAVESVG